jgi:peptidoglycan/xylan/chitin deacetylase (PgdA/CDA1 family)
LSERIVSNRWLEKLDAQQFAIGAHGHEHQRFSMMSREWQEEDLDQNVEILSAFSAFRPLFAVPFGRSHDCSGETVEVANGHGLKVLMSAGGLNVGPERCYRRVPSDGSAVPALIDNVIAAARTAGV